MPWFFSPFYSPDDPQGGSPATPDHPPAGTDNGGDAGDDGGDAGDAGGNDGKRFTQKDVDRLIADARRKEREKLRTKAPKTKTKTTKAKQDDDDDDSPAASPEDKFQRMLDFRDVAAEHGLTRKTRKRLEREFLASGEDDAETWLAEAVEDYGLGKTPDSGNGSTDDSTDKTKRTTPGGPPASDRGGPAAPPDSAVMSNPLRWTPEHVQAIIASQDSYAKGVQEVRRRFMEGMKSVEITFPRGK